MELKGNIVITLEDVLFESSKGLAKYIRNNYYPTFCTKINEIPLDYNFDNREYKSLLLSLIKTETDLSRHSQCMKYLKDNFYNKENVFRNHIITSELYQKITSSRALQESNLIQNIYILYSVNNENNEIMEKIMKEFFKSPKFKLIPVVTLKESEEFIRSHNWNLLITDVRDLVNDYIFDSKYETKSHLKGKEFFMPNRNYSRLSDYDERLIEELGAMINYY